MARDNILNVAHTIFFATPDYRQDASLYFSVSTKNDDTSKKVIAVVKLIAKHFNYEGYVMADAIAYNPNSQKFDIAILQSCDGIVINIKKDKIIGKQFTNESEFDIVLDIMNKLFGKEI